MRAEVQPTTGQAIRRESGSARVRGGSRNARSRTGERTEPRPATCRNQRSDGPPPPMTTTRWEDVDEEDDMCVVVVVVV